MPRLHVQNPQSLHHFLWLPESAIAMGAPRDLRPASQPRRSARIQKPASTATAAARLDIENRGGITKSKTQPKPKAGKQSQQRFDCTTCGRNLAASSFPKYLPTDNCDHLINTCRACLKQWIAIQIDNTTYDKITCPECPQLMQNSDIKLHATANIHERFDELERRGIADKTPGWRWCLAPRCKAGQVHQPPVQTHHSISGLGPLRRTARRVNKSKGFVPVPNICTCNDCGAKACVDCDRPWHEGETCEDFQKRLKSENFEKEEAATLKTIQRESKPCPQCKVNIQRNGGCDAMRCSSCGKQFCFLCLRLYDEIHQTGHGPACMYSQPGRFDPHLAGGPMLVGGVVLGVGALMAGARAFM